MAAGARDWTTCPGCGLRLPAARPTTDRRLRASSACLQLYDEVVAHGLSDPRLAGSHQLRVDAYTAQHVGEETPAIGIPFALVGLHLRSSGASRGRRSEPPTPRWRRSPSRGRGSARRRTLAR